MFKYIFILALMIFAFWLIKNKIKVKWKTFFKKGFKKDKNVFGVRFIAIAESKVLLKPEML